MKSSIRQWLPHPRMPHHFQTTVWQSAILESCQSKRDVDLRERSKFGRKVRDAGVSQSEFDSSWVGLWTVSRPHFSHAPQSKPYVCPRPSSFFFSPPPPLVKRRRRLRWKRLGREKKGIEFYCCQCLQEEKCWWWWWCGGGGNYKKGWCKWRGVGIGWLNSVRIQQPFSR